MEQIIEFKDKTIDTLTKEKTIFKDYTVTLGGWVTLAVTLCSCILFVVSFATVGWGHVITEATGTDSFTRDIGLWQECHSVLGCSGAETTPAIQAAQAFAILSLLVLVPSFILLCIYIFDPTYGGHPLIALAVLTLMPVTVVFLLILICVYGAHWTVPRFVSPQHATRLAYSFGLTVTAFLLQVGASFFMMFEVLAQAEQVRKGVIFVKGKLTKKDKQQGNDSNAQTDGSSRPPPGIAHSANEFGQPLAIEKLKRMSFQGYTLEEGFNDPFHEVSQWQEVDLHQENQSEQHDDIEPQPPEPVDYSKRERQRGRRHQGHAFEDTQKRKSSNLKKVSSINPISNTDEIQKNNDLSVQRDPPNLQGSRATPQINSSRWNLAEPQKQDHYDYEEIQFNEYENHQQRKSARTGQDYDNHQSYYPPFRNDTERHDRYPDRGRDSGRGDVSVSSGVVMDTYEQLSYPKTNIDRHSREPYQALAITQHSSTSGHNRAIEQSGYSNRSRQERRGPENTGGQYARPNNDHYQVQHRDNRNDYQRQYHDNRAPPSHSSGYNLQYAHPHVSPETDI